MEREELKALIVSTIEEVITPNPVELDQKWELGRLILEPSGDQQAKEIPLEVFFKKLTGVRDSLRVLEQKINTNNSISVAEKTNLQSYITKCYGSLTTFNILFKNGKDRFIGSGKGSSGPKEKLTFNQAKAKLGLNEY